MFKQKDKMNGIIECCKKNIQLLLGIITFSCIIYSVLMSNALVNQYDGYWRNGSSWIGQWELSTGRWFWLYLDRLRFEISVNPFTSFLTLCIFSVGILVFMKPFLEKKRINVWKKGLIAAIFLSNVVILVALSYIHMAPTYAVSFLFAVLAAYVLIVMKSKIWSIVISAVFICFMMGSYQASIGITCFMLLLYFMYQLYLSKDGDTWKTYVFFWLRSLAAGIFGGVLYMLVLKVHLYVFHVEESSYNGMNVIQVSGMLKNLFSSIQQAYQQFFSYFFGLGQSMVRSNRLQNYGIYYICFGILLLILMGMLVITKINLIKKVVFVIGLGLIPLFCNIVQVIAYTTGISIQMTTPMGIVIPGLFCLIYAMGAGNPSFCQQMQSKRRIIMASKSLLIVIGIILLYGNTFMVLTDQKAMQYGQNAVNRFGERIMDELQEMDMLGSEFTYCFVGRPADNDLFYQPEIYEYANDYAKHGNWFSGNDWQYMQELAWNALGLNLELADEDTCQRIESMEEVQQMDGFLKGEFVKVIDGVVVVKIG